MTTNRRDRKVGRGSRARPAIAVLVTIAAMATTLVVAPLTPAAGDEPPPLIEFVQGTGLENPRIGGALYDVRVADVTGDGVDDDIALGKGNTPIGTRAFVAVAPGFADGTKGTATKVFELPEFPGRTGAASVFWGGSIAVADVIGSSVPDIVVGHTGSLDLYVLEGMGDGTFAEPVTVATTFETSKLVTGDFNGDGHEDLAANSGGNWLIYNSTAKGAWGEPAALTMPGSYAAYAVVDDYDNDGDLDIIPASAQVWLFENDGTGSFAPGVTLTSPRHDAWSLQTGDFTNDGALDVAVSDPWGMVLYVNDGNGALSAVADPTFDFRGGMGQHNTEAADVDGDGNLDAVFLRGESIAIGFGDGSGGLTMRFWVAGDGAEDPPHAEQWGSAVRVGDRNGDGRNDITVAARGGGGGSLTTLLADPTRDADFLAPELYRDDDGRQWLDSKKGVTPIDMDGDADLDLVYLYNFGVHNGPAGIRFRQNDGTGKFGPPQNAGTVPGCGFSQLAAADFDQNGEDDLLCTSGGSGAAFNDGAGHFVDSTGLTVNTGGFGGVARNHALADFNADGHPDVVHYVTNACCPFGEPWVGGLVVNLYNPEVPHTFVVADPAGIPLGSSGGMVPGPVVAGDFTNDGHADVIATRSPDGEKIRLFPGNGDGTFGAEITSTPDGLNGFEGMQAADVDGDGNLDMVGNANNGAGVQVVRGNGDGTFTEVHVTPADVYAGDFVRDDFNGDGRADFAGTGWQSGIVSMPGLPDGSFGEVRRASGNSARIPGLASGELDGDGLVDIVSVGGGGLAVLINSSEQAPPPPPKPDLRPSAIDAPDAVEAGERGSITYTVTNDGGGVLGASWVDRVYLSADPVWDPTDPLFFSVARSGDLAQGASYEQTVTNPFIPEAVGDHHVIVRTDLFDAVDESDQADNLLVGDVVDVQIPVLEVDDPQTLDLASGERAYRRIAATEADLLLEESGPVDDAASIVVGDGRVPTATSHDVAADPDAHPSLVLAAVGDERIVLVTGRAAATDGADVTLSLRELGFELLDVSPAAGSNAGATTVALTGAGFTDDVTAHLVAGDVERDATDVVVHGRASLEARFDLTGLSVGDYTVEVRRGEDTAALPDGFEVTDDAPGLLDLHVSTPGVMRVNSLGTARVTVVNTGGTDLGVPLVRLSSPHVLMRGPGPDGAYHEDDLALFPRVAGGPERVIPPHSTVEIAVPYLLTPEVILAVSGGGSTEITFKTTLFRDDAPYGVDDFAAALDAHRPPGMADPSWTAIKGALTSPEPATFGDYVQLLADVNLDALQFGRHLATEDEHLDALVDRAVVFTDGPSVAGRVHLPDDAPVTAGEVHLLDGDELVATGPVWPDGSFAVWDVPAGTYQVRVDGYLQPVSLPTVDVPSTGALDLDVEVEAGDRLRGFVTRASDGRGVPGATIEVYDAVSGRLATTTAGLDGRYEVRGLSIGPKQLMVRADGFAVHGPVELDVDLPDDATADVALQPGSGISGVVRDADASPVTGAAVSITSIALGIHREVATDAEGTYVVEALPAGTYDVRAFTLLDGTAFADGVAHDGVTPSTVDLTLGPAATIQGTVTDVDGAQIAGATVDLVVTGYEPFVAATDVDGNYTLADVPPGERTITARAEGYLDQPVDVTLAPGETATVDIELVRTGRISGRVTLPNGAPLEGIDITVTATTPTDPVVPPFVLHTDADGRYVFDPLPLGGYRVAVRGGVEQATTTLDHADADQVLDFEVELGWIEGRVVDGDGAPIAGVVTFIRSLDHPGALPLRQLTGPDGTYRYYITRDGSYEVFVSDERVGLFALPPVDALVGETTIVPDVVPMTAGALEVTVHDDGAAAVAGALVELRRPDQHERTDPLLLTTDAEGTVRFPALEPATYEVGVRADGRQIAVEVVDVVDDELTVDVALSPGFTLSGTVSGPGGEPLGGALATLVERNSGEHYYVGSRPDGTWAHTSLPDGTYDGWITHRLISPIRLTDLTPEPSAADGAVSSAPPDAPATPLAAFAADAAALDAPTAVTGVVLGQDGSTIAHAEVELLDSNGTVIGTTTSDASGAYDVPAVAGDGFSIRVRAADGEQTFPLPPIPAEGLQFDVPGAFEPNAIPPPPPGETDPTQYLETWVRGLPRPERDPRQAELAARLGGEPTECPPVQAAWRAAKGWLDRSDEVFGAWSANYETFRNSWKEFGIPAIRLVKLIADLVALQQQLAAQVAAGAVEKGISHGIDEADIWSLFANKWSFIQTGSTHVLGGDITYVDYLMDTLAILGDLALDIGKGLTTTNVIAGAAVFVTKINDARQTVQDLGIALEDRRIYIDGYNRSKRQYFEALNTLDIAVRAFERAREIGCPDPDDPDDPDDPKPTPKPDDPQIVDKGDGTWTVDYENKTLVVNSRDPNSVDGPGGYGDDRWVSRSQQLDYAVHFENDPAASAPAQEVTVTYPLDPAVDAASVELGDVGFGSVRVEVPDGLAAFETTSPLEGTDDYVAIKGWVDVDTRSVTWSMRTIDPDTGDLPVDPLAGFLPPNDASHRGEGFLELSMSVLPDTPVGTTVSATASIVFDVNEPIVTEPWTNRIDVDAPRTGMAGLPDESPASFLVSWPATDDGSGAARHFVFVSVDGGAFEPWLLGTPDTSATFTGEVGHTYSFEVKTVDGVGHVEAARVPVGTTRVVAGGDPPPRPGGGSGAGGAGGSGGAAPPASRDASVALPPRFTG